jgi:hypothetical protein
MRELTAFDIIEALGEELDIIRDADKMRLKAYFAQWAYDLVKQSPEHYIYEKDGTEYVKVFDNYRIPFIVHMRIAGIDNTIPDRPDMGCRRVVEEN